MAGKIQTGVEQNLSFRFHWQVEQHAHPVRSSARASTSSNVSPTGMVTRRLNRARLAKPK